MGLSYSLMSLRFQENHSIRKALEGEYDAKKKRKANALVISRNPLDPDEPPIVESRSFRQSQLHASRLPPNAVVARKAAPARESTLDAESAGPPEEMLVNDKPPAENAIKNTAKVNIVIPPDLTMATAIRAYNEWPDESGSLVNTMGALLPPYYMLAVIAGFEWAMHNSTLLNDNCDGTFSTLGQYNEIVTGERRPPIVKSKNALPADASPLMEPQPPPHWADAKLREAFSAGQARLSSTAFPGVGQGNKRTVDEIMFTAGPLDPAEGKASESSDLSDLSSPTSMSDYDWSGSGLGRQHRDPSEQLRPAPDNEEGLGEAASTEGAAHTAARRNWELIRKHFTNRHFPPPKAGALMKLLSQPCRRGLVRNPNFQFTVDHPKTVSLLVVQLFGDEAPVPCDGCAQGHGPFRGCVALSKEVAEDIQKGVISCANCAYKGRHQGKCNLKELLPHHASLAAADNTRRGRHVHYETVAAPWKPPIARGATNSSSDEFSLSQAAQKQAREDKVKTYPMMRKVPSLPSNLATNAQNSHSTTSQVLEVALDGSEAGSGQQVELGAGSKSQSTKTDGRFDFHVITIPTGTALQLQPDYSNFRLCSLVTGKVMVQFNGEPAFQMGAGGVLQLLQGVNGEIVNSFGINAVLQVSTIRL
ncbi:hypothetical protein VPNG_10119 [Cytospora leucostoma]|uniref:Uncharacterized protein n=1 Tax=Cytospora leucostoma TaxID=1230097 RepID=A0A423VEN0_9PEZI|nr:hypothetical protein VPNG_10119 [Cytospora leucostoma]